jgi:hypothetical protein
MGNTVTRPAGLGPVVVQANRGKSELTLSAVPEAARHLSSAPTAPSLVDGLAPNTIANRLGQTRLCGRCATLIREDVATGAWRHCAVGFDHEPDPDAYSRVRGTIDVPIHSERDRAVLTESELRLLDGNR